jgi:hypothetical protein
MSPEEAMEVIKKIFVELKNEWTRDRVAAVVATYPATIILVCLSLLTFITVMANFIIQALSWIMYFLNIGARHVFSILYPAALVALTIVWCINILRIHNVDRFEFPQNYPSIALILRLIWCIVAGQLTLFSLPPIINFFAMPFASAPTLLFTIVFSVGTAVYGIYLMILKTVPRAVDTRQPRIIMENLTREGLDTGENDACIVCLVNPKTHLIKPCNHFCVCGECIRQLNECPLCKRPINMHERIYST